MKTDRNREKIKRDINDSLIMLNDIRSFQFLRSGKGQKILNKYFLGGGNLLSAIGLFAILNYLSKIHFVLRKGTYVDNCHRKETIKVKRENITCSKYIKIPRLGEVNETEAFVLLIKTFPKDVGLPQNDERIIKKVWNDWRNYLSHMAKLPKGNIAITFMWKSNQAPEKSNLKPFRVGRELLIEEEKYRKNPKVKNVIESTHCYIDPLMDEVKSIADWLCKEIDSNAFKKEYLEKTVSWLKIED